MEIESIEGHIKQRIREDETREEMELNERVKRLNGIIQEAVSDSIIKNNDKFFWIKCTLRLKIIIKKTVQQNTPTSSSMSYSTSSFNSSGVFSVFLKYEICRL